MKTYPIRDAGNRDYEQELNQAFFEGFICAKVRNPKQLIKMTVKKRIKFCMAALRKNAFLTGGSSAREREREAKRIDERIESGWQKKSYLKIRSRNTFIQSAFIRQDMLLTA